MSRVITGTEIHPLIRARRMASELPWPTMTSSEEMGQERPTAEDTGEADADRERVERQRRGRGEVAFERRQRRRGPAAAGHGCASTASALRARLRPTAISVQPARKPVSVDASTANRPRAAPGGGEHPDACERRIGDALGAPPGVGGGGAGDDDDQPEAFAGIALELAERRAELDRRQHLQRVDADVGSAEVDAAGDEPRGEPDAVGAEHEAGGGDDRPLEDVGVGERRPAPGRRRHRGRGR